jgi:hypothetical protein
MQPDQVTEGEYRVITHPRPTADMHKVENYINPMSASWWKAVIGDGWVNPPNPMHTRYDAQGLSRIRELDQGGMLGI